MRDAVAAELRHSIGAIASACLQSAATSEARRLCGDLVHLLVVIVVVLCVHSRGQLVT